MKLKCLPVRVLSVLPIALKVELATSVESFEASVSKVMAVIKTSLLVVTCDTIATFRATKQCYNFHNHVTGLVFEIIDHRSLTYTLHISSQHSMHYISNPYKPVCNAVTIQTLLTNSAESI
jgi:hypothetical protein